MTSRTVETGDRGEPPTGTRLAGSDTQKALPVEGVAARPHGLETRSCVSRAFPRRCWSWMRGPGRTGRARFAGRRNGRLGVRLSIIGILERYRIY